MPEPPRKPTEEQGEEWKDDGADARATAARANPREERRHDE